VLREESEERKEGAEDVEGEECPAWFFERALVSFKKT
jgi:hypothetical protein